MEKVFVLSAAGADNDNANPNKIIFTIKAENYQAIDQSIDSDVKQPEEIRK